MENDFNPARPYIPVQDSNSGRIINVQRCAFIFADKLTDCEIALIEKDEDLIFHQVDRGYFIAHYLDDAKWFERLNIHITDIYPAKETEFPATLSPQSVLLH